MISKHVIHTSSHPNISMLCHYYVLLHHKYVLFGQNRNSSGRNNIYVINCMVEMFSKINIDYIFLENSLITFCKMCQLLRRK